MSAVETVVRVHVAAFPEFFMTQLGPGFLREYYQCVLEYPGGIILREPEETGAHGFVAGFIDPAGFYTALRRRRVRLVFAAALRLIVRPRRVLTMLADYRRAGMAESQTPDPASAELSSLAVHPDAAGKGVGSRLVRRFISEATARGAGRVVLTTDAHGNDAVNSFYVSLGFSLTRTFEARRGRVLNEYARLLGDA